jgi:LytR cell envelope-related transcriptional attenuator
VQHAESIQTTFPWRTTTLVVGAIAAIELLALIAVGAARLAPAHHARAVAHGARKPLRTIAHHVAPAPVRSVPLRPRTSVRVLVLNGNGVSGAASSEARRLELRGYRIGGAGNAERHDYARSMVMFVPGWLKEARRLAHDTGVRLVAPVDGMPRSQLRGSKIVLLLGS